MITQETTKKSNKNMISVNNNNSHKRQRKNKNKIYTNDKTFGNDLIKKCQFTNYLIKT